MKKLIQYGLYALIAGLTLQSCNSDDDSSEITPPGEASKSVLIVNEGDFSKNEGEITFITDTEIKQNFFRTVNPGKVLGKVAQSMFISDKMKQIYIVVNGSNTIEIVDQSTFKSKATISTQLHNPRFAAADETYLYVTNWGDGSNKNDDYVAVYNLSNNAFVRKIAVTEGPEKIMYTNNELIVAHKGGYGNGNTISLIDLKNNDQITPVLVGDVPTAIEKEGDYLFVLAQGLEYAQPTVPGKLTRFNLKTNKIDYNISFKKGEFPSHLAKENGQLYYILNKAIYRIGLNDKTLPSKPLFGTTAQNVYGFSIKDDAVYVADALNFTGNGRLFKFTLNGTLTNTYATGVMPNGIYFND